MGVNNVAYGWQSHKWDESIEMLESWYPSDNYVDWCGYSFFARWDESNMIKFARKKGKPVFIVKRHQRFLLQLYKKMAKQKIPFYQIMNKQRKLGKSGLFLFLKQYMTIPMS